MFIAKRTDGLGERLRAILNAFALSELYGARFGFYWDDDKFNKEGHAIDSIEKVFSSNFIDAYHIDQDVAESAKPLHKVLFSGSGVFYCDQVVEEAVFESEPHRYGDFKAKLSESFWKIGFSESIELAINAAMRVKLPESCVAIHLRAGDVIYGGLRSNISSISKAISYPSVENLVNGFLEERGNVLLAGQDLAVISLLSQQAQVTSIERLHPESFGRVESAIFDAIVMSRAESVYAGSSGFAVLSSIVGGIPLLNPERIVDQAEVCDLVVRSVTSTEISPDVPKEQVGFACKKALVLGFLVLERKDFDLLCDKGLSADPDNVVFPYMRVWRDFRDGRVTEADKGAERILADHESLVSFLKSNSRTRWQRRFFAKTFGLKSDWRQDFEGGSPFSDLLELTYRLMRI